MREAAEVQLRTLVFFSVHSLSCSSWICLLVVCQVAYWKVYFLAQLLWFLLVEVLFFSSRYSECIVKWYSIGLSSSVPLRSCKRAERQCCHDAFAVSQISQFCGLIRILHLHREAVQDQCTSSVPLSLKLGLNWFSWSNCRRPGGRWCSSAQGEFASAELHNRELCSLGTRANSWRKLNLLAVWFNWGIRAELLVFSALSSRH